MPKEQEVLQFGDREVVVTNPSKVFFEAIGATKVDLVRYYLAVAPGALAGAGGRPMALKRIVNLGCIDLNPHPVRADDLDHPDELRVDLDPVPGVGWAQIRDVAMVTKESLESVGLVGWPKTSGSRGIHVNVRIERRWTYPEVRRAALAIARDVERRAPDIATSKWWKEERRGVFLDYNQNAKDRTVASAYSVRPTKDARVSAPVAWDELADCDPADFTLATMPARFD